MGIYAMNGLLFVGGEGPSKKQFKPYHDRDAFVIAADSGLLRALALGVSPDLVVGDMDSIPDLGLLSQFPAEKIVKFPEEKDETDTEIGMRFMREKGIERITIVGGGAGRLAHLLGILMLFQRENEPHRWITAKEEVTVVQSFCRFDGCLGQIFSFFPLTESIDKMHSTGLKWPLDGLIWRAGQAGISNIAIENVVTVAIEKGKLLSIREFP